MKKIKSIRAVKVIVVLLGVLTISTFTGCKVMNFIMGVNAHLTAKGYVSKSTAAGKAIKLISKGTGKGTGGGFINNYDQISITPTKLLLTFKYITLWENYEIDYDNTNSVVQCSGKHIDIAINETKNLTQLDTYTPIFTIDQDINSDQIGTYKCLDLQLDDKCVVSGSVTVNGKVYSFTDTQLSLGWGGIEIPLRDEAAINITKDSSLTAGIVIDIEDGIYLRMVDDITPESDPGFTGGFCVVVDSDPPYTFIGFNQPVILPFFGSSEPNVKRVLLDITNDEIFDDSLNSDYFLRVLCILDENNELMSAGWMPIYGDEETGVTANMCGYSPSMLYLGSIVKNADGSYKIDDTMHWEGDTSPRDRALHFPAFQIGPHEGIFYYGDEDYPDRKTAQYTATIQN